MRSFGDVVHALSWRIAAETASCVPQSFIVELHPAQSADVLTVRQWDRDQVAAIDRLGIVIGMGVQITWPDVLRLGTAGTVRTLLQAGRFATKRRPTTPQRRTYRILAELLESSLPDPQSWRAHSAMLDTAGHGVSLQPHLLMGIPELTMADPYQVWTVLRDGQPVLAITEGSAFFPDGYRMTLMEVGSDEERSVANYLLRRISETATGS